MLCTVFFSLNALLLLKVNYLDLYLTVKEPNKLYHHKIKTSVFVKSPNIPGILPRDMREHSRCEGFVGSSVFMIEREHFEPQLPTMASVYGNKTNLESLINMPWTKK